MSSPPAMQPIGHAAEWHVTFPTDRSNVKVSLGQFGVSLEYNRMANSSGGMIQTMGVSPFQGGTSVIPPAGGSDPSTSPRPRSEHSGSLSSQPRNYTYRTVPLGVMPRVRGDTMSKWQWLVDPQLRTAFPRFSANPSEFHERLLASMEEARKVIVAQFSMDQSFMTPDKFCYLTEDLVFFSLVGGKLTGDEEMEHAAEVARLLDETAATLGCKMETRLPALEVYRRVMGPLITDDPKSAKLVVGTFEDGSDCSLLDWLIEEDDERGRSVRLESYSDASLYVLTLPDLAPYQPGITTNILARATVDVCEAEGDSGKIRQAIMDARRTAGLPVLPPR